MPGIAIDDGYTLDRNTKETDGNGDPIPFVAYSYRPAMPAAIYDHDYRLAMAKSGGEQLEISSTLLASHLVKWDVTKDGAISQITPATVAKLPLPVLQEILRTVTTWAPKKLAEAGKNS